MQRVYDSNPTSILSKKFKLIFSRSWCCSFPLVLGSLMKCLVNFVVKNKLLTLVYVAYAFSVFAISVIFALHVCETYLFNFKDIGSMAMDVDGVLNVNVEAVQLKSKVNS